MVWYILGAVALFVILFVASTYNVLVKLRNMVENQWSQIDIQLKRRRDLIPALVETVKGAAAHEKETLESVIEARGKAVNASTPEEAMKAEGELTRVLGKLMMLTENYPDLKANQNFLSLQNELSEVEDKISYSRQFYNDAANKYNNKVHMVPSNFIASMFKFNEKPYFELDSEEDRKMPEVKF